MPAQPRLTAVATAVPDHEVHAAFVDWARRQLADPREQRLFERMAGRAGIGQRWSVLPRGANGGSPVAEHGFYQGGFMPSTAARMRIYAEAAPELALAAARKLPSLAGITHLVVASCTGFVAPGVDQIIAARLGLAPTVERLLVGFMGCYAGVTALKAARSIARSEPDARVLVIAVELSTLHLQDEHRLEPLLAMLQFGDGAAAALVSGEGEGLGLERPFAAALAESEGLIRWTIGDTGFAMHLSGEVPGRIGAALAEPDTRRALTGGIEPGAIDGWAVHAGGRSILDAVEAALALPPDALAASRAVLRDNGNMSSATLLFALARLLPERPQRGVALAFGPGLAAEGLTLAWRD